MKFETEKKPEAILKGKTKKIFSLELPICIGPITILIFLFVFVPLGVILFFSFLKTGLYGEIVYTFSLDNFRSILGGGYGTVFLNSFYLALQTNIICILVGYPFAYFLTIYGGRWKLFLLFLIVVPSWTAYLIRLYAFKIIIGNSGPINALLLNFNLISEPLKMIYTPFAVMAALVYTWIPYMILPLYASLDGLDSALLEAATDLGANPVRRFIRITLPLTKGGLFAGSLLVFIPTLGDWLVPHLFGGSKVMMVGNLIADQYILAGNIPAGSSLAIILTATLILILFIVIKLGGKESMERVV